MSLYLGNTLISGISSNSLSLFDIKWSDYLLNDMSWLRADTFSWQDGTVYSDAYNHLLGDILNITPETETIGSYTVTFYRADDGHKICLADQETTVNNIYTETGISWYYILDSGNTRFKLPRMTYKYWKNQNTIPVKGNGIALGLTDGTNLRGAMSGGVGRQYVVAGAGAYGANVGASKSTSSGLDDVALGVTTDASKSGIVADVSNTTMQIGFYLYFYVGEFSQTATEQTAGLNAELFNSKADKTAVDGQWVRNTLTILSNAAIDTTQVTHDISSYLPNDNYNYEILVQVGNANGSAVHCASDLDYDVIVRGASSGSAQLYNSGIIIIGSGRSVKTYTTSGTSSNTMCFLLAYRRIGTNS